MDEIVRRIQEKLLQRGNAERQRAEEWQRSLKPTIYRGNNLFQELGGEPLEGRYLGQVGLVPGQSVPNIGRNPNKPVIPGLPIVPEEGDSKTVVIQKKQYVSAGVLPFQSENFATGTAYDLVAIINGEYITLDSFDKYEWRGLDPSGNTFSRPTIPGSLPQNNTMGMRLRADTVVITAWVDSGKYFKYGDEEWSGSDISTETLIQTGDNELFSYGIDAGRTSTFDPANPETSVFADYQNLTFHAKAGDVVSNDAGVSHNISFVGLRLEGEYSIVLRNDSFRSRNLTGNCTGANVGLRSVGAGQTLTFADTFNIETLKETSISNVNNSGNIVYCYAGAGFSSCRSTVELSLVNAEFVPGITYYNAWIHLDDKGWIIWYSFYEVNTEIEKRDIGLDGMEYGREWLYGFAGKGSVIQGKRIYTRKYNSDKTIEYSSDIDDVITPFSETEIIPEDFRENSKTSFLEWSGLGFSDLSPFQTNYRGKIFSGDLSSDNKTFLIISEFKIIAIIDIPENLEYADYVDLVNTGFDFQLVFTEE